MLCKEKEAGMLNPNVVFIRLQVVGQNFVEILQPINQSNSTTPMFPSFTQVIKSAIGPLPLFSEEEETEESGDSSLQPAAPTMPATNRPAVLADGSYATQVAIPDSFSLGTVGGNTANLRCRALCLRVRPRVNGGVWLIFPHMLIASLAYLGLPSANFRQI